MTAFGPLFDRGLLPHLAALWRRSAHGTLRSSTPMVTPVAWTDFSTGCTPEVHGIHEFYHVDANDRTIRPNHAGRVRAPSLWQILGAAGARGRQPEPADDLSAARRAGDRRRRFRCARPGMGLRPVPRLRPRDHGRAARLHAQDRLEVTARSGWTTSRRSPLATGPSSPPRPRPPSGPTPGPTGSAMMVHFHNLDSLQHRLWPYLDSTRPASADAAGTRRSRAA